MKKYSGLFIGILYFGIFGIMLLSVLLVINGVKNYVKDIEPVNYTIDDIFSDITPVVKTQTDNIIKPYLSDSVSVGKYFYDYQSDKTKQEDSIIFFKNTYIQNTGVDYVSNDDFDVVSILDGEVISIDNNEIYGNIITIKHNDNLKSVYCNVSDVIVNVGYKVSQGEIIATSTQSKIDESNKSTLHFEVYYKGNAIDPEKLYTLTVSELE